MRQWSVRLLTVLIVGGAASGIAACTSSGGGGEPTLTPGPPSTASPAPSSSTGTPSPTGPATTGPNVRPGEKPPELIADGKKHNATGALIFAGYYMRAKDWSLATMDTYLLKQLALPSCQTCNRWNKVVEKYAAEGAYVKGGRLLIGETQLTDAAHTDVRSDYIVDIKFVQEPDVVIRSGASPSTEATQPEDQGSYVFVSWVSGGWKIVEEEADS